MLSRKLLVVLLVLTAIIVIGAGGFMLIEKWPFFDSLYMTVITLTTVGFGEVRPLSQGGRVFTIFLLICGMGTLLYGISTATAFFIEGELTDILRRRKMDKKIEKLQGHYIICGAKGTGRYIIEELIKTGNKFVVVEEDPEEIKKIGPYGEILFVQGNATDDSVLLKAGIKEASGLITTFPSDRDNVFVVLTAKELNPSIRVISKVTEEQSVRKLYHAGADEAILTDSIGGLRLASLLVRPSVVTFFDEMLRNEEITIRTEEGRIVQGSPIVGRVLADTKIPEKTGLIVIAIKDSRTGRFSYNPNKDVILKENDVLIVMGTPDQLAKLKTIIQG